MSGTAPAGPLGSTARRGPGPAAPAAPCCPPAPAPVRGGSLARVALVGNPNVGKSTLFNALTGARQHVGNWPGKTTAVAIGSWRTPDGQLELIDLPGTYSLVPGSPDEALTRDLLIEAGPDRPDLVLAVLDAANLARNLYLLAQLLDAGVPVITVLTMVDVADGRGLRLDRRALAELTGVPVVAVRPRTGDGLDDLRTEVSTALAGRPVPPAVTLGEPIERALTELVDEITAVPRVAGGRGLAVALLARDDVAVPAELAARAATIRAAVATQLAAGTDDDAGPVELEIVIAELRYAWVHRVIRAVVRRPASDRPTASDRADRVLTSRWFGLPLFLFVMWGVFEATTRLAAPLQQGLSWLVDGPVRDGTGWLLARAHLGGTWVEGLIRDGLVAGVGQLLTFAPLMTIMFVLLTLLEDSGYMARAAFVADRFLRVVGLPGRAFLPLIVGFGCNVPAIAGTRILSDARHRLMTSLLVPFVSCSARLTVYVLLADIFFGRRAGSVVFAMYVLSVVLVVAVGITMRSTVFRRQAREALVLELPPYRLPTVRVVATQTWQKLVGFLRTASGIIVAAVVVVWLLAAIPLGAGRFGEVTDGNSLYAGVSRTVAPVFAPAGFGDPHTAGALVTGFVAKEAVVSTFAETYRTSPQGGGVPAGDLQANLRATFERSSGGHPGPAVLAFLVFLLAYTPCAATVAAQRAEIGGRWTAVGALLQLAMAWSLATVIFQIGRLLV